MFERRLYYHIDWALVIAMLALCALGVIMINSTTSDPTRGNSHLYITQLYGIVLALGGFNLQPSEFAKIGVALVLAKYFGENRGAPGWPDLAIAGVLTVIPLGLIAKEPDLGTAMTL